MKPLGIALAALLIGSTLTQAQTPVQLHTRPKLPSTEALERLNLKLAWYTYIPTVGRQDGIAHVQVLRDRILIECRSGTLTSIDPSDGTQQWHTSVGIPFRVSFAPGFNNTTVFAFSGLNIYALDLKTGKQLWVFAPPNAPSAGPSADEERIFFTGAGGHIYVYQLPGKVAKNELSFGNQPTKMAEPRAPAAEFSSPYGSKAHGAVASVGRVETKLFNLPPPPDMSVPQYLWDYKVTGRLEQPPALAQDIMVLADADGTFFAMSKLNREVQYRFQAAAGLAAPMGMYEDIAYVASQDFTVYALNIPKGRIDWRFVAGAPILRKPAVMDQDIYIVSNGGGLSRLNRLDGIEAWRNPAGQRFLASNPKFAYATDSVGRLLVLDRINGHSLTSYDVRDFVVPITNEFSDRIFLASNDGLLICLHDRDYSKPVKNRTVKEPAPPATKTPDKGEPKVREK